MPTDPTRHVSIFSPQAFGQRRVCVIGAGATGSHIVFELAKLGVQNIHVWDFDRVEEPNLASQMYAPADVGRFKVEALRRHVRAATGTDITTHTDRVDGTQDLGEVVYLLTDTMASRREIWEKGLQNHPHINLVVETRMGVDSGRVYAVNPNKPAHVRAWKETLYDGESVEVSACGTSISLGATALVVTGFAVWQLINWFAIERGKEGNLDNEIIFGVRPAGILTRQFS